MFLAFAAVAAIAAVDHRAVRGRDQGPRAGGGVAVTACANRRLPRPLAALQTLRSVAYAAPELRRNIHARNEVLLPGLAAAVLFGTTAAQSADPVKIRASWVAPVSNWASILLEKKDLARHLGKSYVLEPVRYRGTPPMITALANGELEVANLAYSTLGIAIQNAGLDDIRVIADEFRDGVPGHYTPGIPRARRRPDQEAAGPQGQGGRHQRRRQRGRRRHPRHAAQVRAGGQARLHRGRGAVPDHARDAGGKEGRSHSRGAAVLARSGAAQDLARALHPARCDRRDRDDRVDRAQAVPRQEPRRHGRLHGGHAAHRAMVSRPRGTRRRRPRSRRASPSSRPSASAGCSPTRTISAIPT